MFRSLISLCFLIVLLAANMPGSSLFKPAITYPSGGAFSPTVAVGDINGDGNPDLIVSNQSSCYTCANGSVTVLLGNGDGTFQAAQAYDSGGSETGGIAVADLNGDGKLDVVVANSASGTVAVLLGNGDGTLQPARLHSTGDAFPLGLVLGDFNSDGKFDVAITTGCCSAPYIEILLGNGDGSFQSPQSYGVPGDLASGIAAGDLDGDGRLDLAVGVEVSNGGHPLVAIFLGNGDGTFKTPRSFPGGYYPAFADMNRDGKLDLLVTGVCGNPHCTKDGVSVLLGNGDGSFQPPQVYSSGGEVADFVATGDVNRDGKTDAFVANFGGRVGTLLGIGDGKLLPVQLFNAGNRYPVSMAVADINGDGKPDLLVGLYDMTSSKVGVLQNNTFWKTTTTLTSSPNPSIHGQAVTFTATVSSEGWGVPTGQVVFRNGNNGIGHAILDKTGVATLIKKNLPVGSLSIKAVYKGDINSAKSTSLALIQVVNPASE